MVSIDWIIFTFNLKAKMVSDKTFLNNTFIWSAVNNFNYSTKVVRSKYSSIKNFNYTMQVVSSS